MPGAPDAAGTDFDGVEGFLDATRTSADGRRRPHGRMATATSRFTTGTHHSGRRPVLSLNSVEEGAAPPGFPRRTGLCRSSPMKRVPHQPR